MFVDPATKRMIPLGTIQSMIASSLSSALSTQPAAAPALAVEVKGLTKVYAGKRGVTALKGIDLGIPTGSIFGLLGPNGAGKSTMINILAGMVIKTGGTARIWGIDIDEQLNADPTRGARRISADKSPTTVLVIPTDEELMIARHCRALLETRTAAQ